MLPGFDDRKTAALARGLHRVNLAAGRLLAVFEAIANLNTSGCLPEEWLASIEALEYQDAILGLDVEAAAALRLGVTVIERMEERGSDDTVSVFRSIDEKDLRALELIKKLRTAGRLQP